MSKLDTDDAFSIIASLHKERKPRLMHRTTPGFMAAWYDTPQSFVPGIDQQCVQMAIETAHLIVEAHWRRERLELSTLL